MTVYLLLLLFVSICAYRYDYSKNNAWLWVIFFALTLVAGLRDVAVGTDSYNYYFQFTNQDAFAQLNIYNDLTHEVGFDILLGISQKIGSNYASMFLLIAATVYSVAIISIKKGSQSMLISMFVYIALCLSSFCYNGARQGIAIAIYMFSLHYLIRGDFTKHCLIVLLAALFHKTIIVALPMYFLFRRRYNGLTICYIIVAMPVISIKVIDPIACTGIETIILVEADYRVEGLLITIFYQHITLPCTIEGVCNIRIIIT